MPPNVITSLRADYHRSLCDTILGYRKDTTVFTNADGSSRASVDMAARMAAKLGHPPCSSPELGQAAGARFTTLTKDFLKSAFDKLRHLRPGQFPFSVTQAAPGIGAFDQYEHLAELQKVLLKHKDLAAALGGDYLITPDIVVGRVSLSDAEINAQEQLVGQDPVVATYTPLRAANFAEPRQILHASISCKWTMRSDRAQNTRTEALNLIRNRKGKTPHIIAVTVEPLPTRLASIAMGTGDIDCTYHAALHELMAAASEGGWEDQVDLLQTLVGGRRLRDISDLPFDLAV
jgi:hypothetical protein